MTELSFKGKEFVYNHHLSVPFRPLVPDATKGIGPVDLNGNLIIQGDNLHALKALLRLCCTNPMRDSSRESSVVAGLHEQTHTPRLQDQELALV